LKTIPNQLNFLFSFLLFFICTSINGQVILLKDGSAINGTVIKDTENEVQVIILNSDTLEISYKYIDKLITKETYQELYLNQRVIPRHKTEGLFLNIEPLAHPFAISAGKRLNNNLNVGGTIFYGGVRSNNFGIAPYIRYYFGDNLLSTRFFTDAFLGVSKRNNSFFSRTLNEYPITGSLAIGIQLPSLKKFRWYFKIGGIFNVDRLELETNSTTNRIIEENQVNYTLQASLIAIQF